MAQTTETSTAVPRRFGEAVCKLLREHQCTEVHLPPELSNVSQSRELSCTEPADLSDKERDSYVPHSVHDASAYQLTVNGVAYIALITTLRKSGKSVTPLRIRERARSVNGLPWSLRKGNEKHFKKEVIMTTERFLVDASLPA